jgi:hypothetical protein
LDRNVKTVYRNSSAAGIKRFGRRDSAEQNRALRISGEETTRGKHRDAWTVADYATLQRIARSSMNQLATFLTSAGAGRGPECRFHAGFGSRGCIHARAGGHAGRR